VNARARLATLLGCVALAACGQLPTTAAQPSNTPATPVSVGPCKLPVASGDAPVDGRAGDGTTGHGGFIQFPAATFTADPASLGDYDLGFTRWVPTFRAWVEPAGAHYAWGENSVVHIVDVAHSADQQVTVPAPSAVVSFETGAIYLARVVPGSGAPTQGLATIDAAGGGYHQIAGDGVWSAIGGGFAYGQDQGHVRKLDLHTGAVSDAGAYQGTTQVLGATATVPLVAVTSGSTYTVYAGTASVFSGAPGDADPVGPVAVDGSVVWFGSRGGAVWRWDGNGSVARVASVPFGAVVIAGGCH
jgi:hypothetical protein